LLKSQMVGKIFFTEVARSGFRVTNSLLQWLDSEAFAEKPLSATIKEAALQIKAGENEKAIALLEPIYIKIKSGKLKPKYIDLHKVKITLSHAYHMKGEGLILQGNSEEALKTFKSSVNINESNWESYHYIGWIYSEREAHLNAINNFKIAVNLHPNELSYNEMAYSFNVLGNYKKAIQMANKAIQINPRHYNAFINRGYAYTLLNKKEKARADYKRALRLNPQSIPAQSNLSELKKR
ncbi:MAG: tetratricopeptide repeat protein, partial [Nitrospinales bacterium]